ncbi:MAG: polysaccharide export protein [Lachnospiraceae bacterium]|nr:polysaccharide export protein [Lachnospiraceae bacterium]
MENQFDEEIEIDLRELFFVLLGKIWIIIGTSIAGVVAAVLFTTLCITPMYQSTASLYILSKSTSLTSLADIQLGTQLTQDYMVIAKSRKVIEQVIKDCELDMTYEQFLGTVSVTNESNTRVLSLTVKNPDPYMAKMIVDKYSQVTAEQTAKIMDTDVPNEVDVGVVADHPVSPSVKKNALIGGMLMFVFVCGIIVVLYLLDDSVKTGDDAEKYLGLTNLGSIPVYESSMKKTGKSKKKSDKSGETVRKLDRFDI